MRRRRLSLAAIGGPQSRLVNDRHCEVRNIYHTRAREIETILPPMNFSTPLQIAISLGLSTMLLACSSDNDNNGDTFDAAPVADSGSTPTPDASDSELVWTPLITGEWTLPAGGENTSDNHTITLDRDIYIGAIRPIEPVGTHHTVLDNGGAGIIYASGVGTNEVIFPDGVGLKLIAGTTLNLQLHIFNPSGAGISGTSGVEIVEVAEADVVNVADLFLPGPFDFNLGPMQETVHSGTCVVQQAQTIFALFPHMHQLGTHFKMSVTKDGTEQMVHDNAYDFDDQAFTNFAPISLSPGDSINTECTWMNSTAQGVGWGDSSTSEMCFSILYRYPAIGGEFCDDGFTP